MQVNAWVTPGREKVQHDCKFSKQCSFLRVDLLKNAKIGYTLVCAADDSHNELNVKLQEASQTLLSWNTTISKVYRSLIASFHAVTHND